MKKSYFKCGILIKKLALLQALIFFTAAGLFADEAANEESESAESPLQFNMSVDFGWDPECYRKTGSLHYSGFKSPYEYLEGRAKFNAEYTIPTPLGENFLLKDANLKLVPTLELSPISVRGMFRAEFTPVPFLVFSAGGSAGTAWHLGSGLGGMRKLNIAEAKYEDLSMKDSFYYDYWAQGVFQFDTGAIWAGDWTHVLFQATYNISYKEVTGFKDHAIGKWMGTENFANGWQYEAVLLLGYGLPYKVYRAGVYGDFWGHYNKDDYGEYADSFKGDFMYVSICPFTQIHLTKNNDLTLLAEFSSRRAFDKDHTMYKEEPALTYTGYEWYFMRVALQWVHRF